MSLHRPIVAARPAQPVRLTGDVAGRKPPHGPLGWGARIEVIVLASVMLWGLIFAVVDLLV